MIGKWQVSSSVPIPKWSRAGKVPIFWSGDMWDEGARLGGETEGDPVWETGS